MIITFTYFNIFSFKNPLNDLTFLLSLLYKVPRGTLISVFIIYHTLFIIPIKLVFKRITNFHIFQFVNIELNDNYTNSLLYFIYEK